ncbi:QcrA and Rieske domain-containing protein [Ohtaekwangia sp.]|uniref:QcrA and Rieske domain-containing protein n=1 Tax=Ohtaekwangia sp. TaxID=2066019 RepID=UPI002F92DB80
MKTRREFLKDTCTTCLGTAFLGFTFSQLTSCSSLPIYKTNLSQKMVRVPVANFAESNLVIVRDLQVPFDILLVKKSETEYNAVYMKCSHQENPVTATKTGLYCSSHGSTFDLDGNVTKEPALKPLKKFKTQLQENQILIDLNS